MSVPHYVAAVVILVLGYYLGTKYPGWITKISGGHVAG